jgi:hypothetical protein
VSEIPAREGLFLLIAAVAGNEPSSSYVEVRPLDPRARQRFVSVRDLHCTVDVVEQLRRRHDFVGVGVAPRVRRSGRADAVERSWALVADVDSAESAAAVRQFHPPPSVVALSRTPGHRHVYWSLNRPIPPEWHRRACLRLAARLGSDPAVADPARVMRAPVAFASVKLLAYTLAEVVGGLPDARSFVPPRPAPQPDGEARQGAVLDGLARVVRDSEPGSRNVRLNWAAYRGGERVAAGSLDPDDLRRELLAAALDAGLGEDEAMTTINSGMHAGGVR